MRKDLDNTDDMLPDTDEKVLRERCAKMKNEILMEEPCPIYEATEEDWNDFWYNYDE